MFWEIFYDLCQSNKTTPNAVAKAVGYSTAICTKWKNGATPNSEALMKLADYFGVTTDYLLGRSNGDYSDVKVALFGGDGEVTDEMWDEVKQFADYVKSKYLKEKK